MNDAVLRIGEVCEVNGRKVYIIVDKNKNLADMFLDGEILKNIAVNSYIEIRKGFLSLIGRVEGEKTKEEDQSSETGQMNLVNRNKRILTVSLAGYIDEAGIFKGGAKELPLIGNEAYIVTHNKIRSIHKFVVGDNPTINIATVYSDDVDIYLPIDGLFNSHIAIFGNTGSGKSNTLAYLFQELTRTLFQRNQNAYFENTHFLLYDFNGEYISDECITTNKHVYNLSTRKHDADKIPMDEEGLINIEVLSIIAQATEKTQKPFLKRMLRFYISVFAVEDPEQYLKNIMRKRAMDVLMMSDKIRAFLLLDYFREILPSVHGGEPVDIGSDLDWHNNASEFVHKPTGTFLHTSPEGIHNTILYNHIEHFDLEDNLLSKLIVFLYLQLIFDVLSNRAQNEHISPVINRLRSKQEDIDKLFDLSGEKKFWKSNFVVINLEDVNLDMKKTIPLLLSKKIYDEQKKVGPEKSLSIIIDEAHNILSTESFRESESWKDYRLETFEEIIKEGRKFSTFMTIASQRPNDISQTITSQAHNYFIHRLINRQDLSTISSAVSYIDRISEESIPTLPVGTCIFSGIACQMPILINIKPLAEENKPRSATYLISEIVPYSDG